MLPSKFTALFAHNNYKFSTKEPGRLSSLYYQDVHGNQGRWRREHPDGEALIYQGKSLRLFVERDYAASGLMDEDLEESRVSRKEFHEIWKNLRDGIETRGNGNAYCGSPRPGFHVVELCSPTYYKRHGSKSTVILQDTTEHNAYDTLKNFAGELIDWSV